MQDIKIQNIVNLNFIDLNILSKTIRFKYIIHIHVYIYLNDVFKLYIKVKCLHLFILLDSCV